MLIDLIITIHKEYLPSMPSILERFKKEGLSVSNVTDYGVIMGSADKRSFEKWSREKEVESIVEDAFTQLPPPDSAIQ